MAQPQQVPKSFIPDAPSSFQPEEAAAPAGGVLQTAMDFGEGFLKSAAKPVKAGGEFLRRNVPMLDALPSYRIDTNLEPENTAQKVGGVVEQMAEFAAPARAEKAALTWIMGKLAPHMAQAPAAVKTVLSLLPRVAVEGSSAAAVASSQGGDPGTEFGAAAVIPVVGKVAGAAAPSVRRIATEQVERFLKPGTKAMKTEALQVVPEMLERGIVGTPSGVARRAGEMRQKVGQKVEAIESRLAAVKPGQVVDIGHVKNMMDRQIRRYTTSAATTPSGARLPVATREVYYRAAKHMRDWLDQLPAQVTVKEAADLKRQWQETVRLAGGYVENSKDQASAAAAKAAARAMRDSLLKLNTVHELRKAYKEFSFWAGLDNILSDTKLRKVGHESWGNRMIASGIATGAGFAGGGGVGAAAMGALALAVQTPTWRLASAQVKNQLADALTSGNWKQVKFLTDRIIKGTVSQATKEQ